MPDDTSGPRRLLVSGYFPRAVKLEGVGTFLGGLAEGLSATGWQVQLLLPAGDYRPLPGIPLATYRAGGPAGPLRYRAILRDAAQLADRVLLVENNPNAVLVGLPEELHDRTLWYFYTPLQSLALVPAMGWRWQAFAHALAKHHLLARLPSWRRRRCLVATEFQARQLRALGAAAVHVHPGTTVPTAAPPDRAAARRELGWDERPVVGYLGHFSPAKGVETLLAACQEHCGADTVLALAYSGKGRLGRAGQAAYRQLAAAGRLREHGVVTPATFLAACDVVALPYPASSIHHLPLVLLESYAAGTAVVTTAIGGLAELHQPAYGDLVPPGNVAALGAALARRLADLPTTHALGRAAHACFNDRLDRPHFCAELHRLLEHAPA